MKCEKFRSLINDFSAGVLAAAEHTQCQNHMAECDNCLALWSEQIESELRVMPDHNFSKDILAKIELDSCQQSEELLGDYLEDSLDTLQRELLHGHLQDCENCQAVLISLEILESEIMRLAEYTPAPGFVDSVLAQTIAIEQSQSWFKKLTGIDLQALFIQLMRRPRFPIEAAFAATVIWTSFFGVPSGVMFSAQADAPVLVERRVVQQRIEDIQSNVNAGMTNLPSLLSEGWQKLSSASRSLIENSIEVTERNGAALSESMAAWLNTSILNNSVDDETDLEGGR